MIKRELSCGFVKKGRLGKSKRGYEEAESLDGQLWI